MTPARIQAVLSVVNVAALRCGVSWALLGEGLFSLLGAAVDPTMLVVVADRKLDVPSRIWRPEGCGPLGYWISHCHIDWDVEKTDINRTILESCYIGAAGYPLASTTLALAYSYSKAPDFVAKMCKLGFGSESEVQKLVEDFWFL